MIDRPMHALRNESDQRSAMVPEAKTKSAWKTWVLPTAQWLPQYQLGWLRPDLVASFARSLAQLRVKRRRHQ
jgi:hypothetical protein